MFNLPKPMLGDVTSITFTSTDLDISIDFYQKLGFSVLFRLEFPFPLVQLTDGALLLMIRLDKNPYCALTYYVRELEKVVAELESAGIEFYQKPKGDEFIKRYLTQSPDKLTISLVTWGEGFAQPPGPTMLTMSQQDYFKPEKYVNKTCGMFGELAHPVADLEQSILFWRKLGFQAISKFVAPYPWAILSDGLAVVGLHQTNHFSYPAMTFFAADMKDKIARLKEAGIKDMSETRGPGNVVLTTPEKQHINLFSLGM